MILEKIPYDMGKKETSSSLMNDFKSFNLLNLTNKEKREINIKFEQNIEEGKYIYSLNYLIIGILYNKEKILEHIRRKGLFRYSKYLNKKCIIKKICEEIIYLKEDLPLNQEEIQYFSSIKNLWPIHSILKEKRITIINEIRKFKRKPSNDDKYPLSFIKTLLAFIEYLFLTNYYPKQKDNPNEINYYNKETIAEAASFIFFTYNEFFSFTDKDFGIIDENYIISKKIESVLLNACHFKQLQEYEIYIDHFAYKCIIDKNDIFIKPPTSQIEKSIQLGYIKTNFMKISYELSALKKYKDVLSMGTFIDIIEKKFKFNFLKYTDTMPYPRFRIESSIDIFKFLSDERFLKEEIQIFEDTLKEQFVDFNNIQYIEIRNNFDLKKFIYINRYFFCLYIILAKGLLNKKNIDVLTILRSLVFGYSSKDKFYKSIEKYCSREDFENFLDVTVWDPKKGQVFDLQYQPILKLGNQYAIPVCLLATSNTIRNIYALEYKEKNPEFFDDGSYDLMSQFLSVSFAKKGFVTSNKISYSYEKGGDIDFIAIKDEFLFLIECKKSLLPINIYDLRTLFDNLNKANTQLKNIIKALKDKSSEKEISKKIDYDLSRIKFIYTAIITNNRIFIGSGLWEHPVRNIQEVINIIDTGIIKYGENQYSIWKKEDFSIEDLIYYLDDTQWNKWFFDAMSEKKSILQFQKFNIIFPIFYLEEKKLLQNIENMNFRRIKNK